MGQTTIHTPTQILQRASHTGRFSDQALILPFNKPVLISSGTFTQEDVDQQTWCLRNPQIGCWVQQTPRSSIPTTTSADDALAIPQIRVGPGLAQSRSSAWSDGVKYVLVIQGRSGASKAKVLVEGSVEGAAATMMFEAINGFSTVFCAAFEGDLRNVSASAAFRAVGELVTAPGEVGGGRAMVGLVCCARGVGGDR